MPAYRTWPGGSVDSEGSLQLVYNPRRGGTYFAQRCGHENAERLGVNSAS